jgi:hypothetical protein
MTEPDNTAGSIPNAVPRSPMFKCAVIGVVAAILAFLLGFIPMWLTAGRNEKARDAARLELRLSQMQNTLASAAIDARRGDYEPARQRASQFFSELRDEADRGNASGFTATQRDALAPLFNQRDQLITLLARSDPSSADRLSDLDVAYRKATGR